MPGLRDARRRQRRRKRPRQNLIQHKGGERYAGEAEEVGEDETVDAKRILERYNYTIPHLPYDNYRRVLVELLDLLGIHKRISTHNGRHTFATTVALGNGVPVEILQKMMGHKNIQTTMIYAKVQRPMIQKQAERLSGLAQ